MSALIGQLTHAWTSTADRAALQNPRAALLNQFLGSKLATIGINDANLWLLNVVWCHKVTKLKSGTSSFLTFKIFYMHTNLNTGGKENIKKASKLIFTYSFWFVIILVLLNEAINSWPYQWLKRHWQCAPKGRKVATHFFFFLYYYLFYEVRILRLTVKFLRLTERHSHTCLLAKFSFQDKWKQTD